ncbi:MULTISPECIES: tRNA dihydrouridine synthase DusB [unclassified Rhizobium]|uniref:tRNA dihydrouridine synthase DusB n=2 Tax=unclassified Rhizobium TaxID=2613769 RepID=UPI001ADA1C9B|nr:MULTISPECIES: tRNA dihydrouridine synthase DusB [unclassified Rhizobium]MBO9098329.1 tRNA dihydrouridine synthase DusB [Rhizobium sp. L58/93]MBO9132867.1 tRNA dihydrouridine synthase DusB [Rhizobium sp. B209b/85]MBO9168595.1 tRNA dihydrouridine synthase DusB [Rhizobium sp. L245/93]MBO9184524.1 tRNA dihydrouridine synthase DusB [Rhizobium sp. E27B/91]QXZ84729.1 tRNA dihydrouridine synthase DusB [Rhizobium sp. K1/93]
MSAIDIASPLSIGPVQIRNRVVLAPMSGVTDLPFRQLAMRFGAGLVVTEMVASRELVQDTAESWSRLRHAGLKPHMVQLAGRDAYWLAEAAKIAAGNGADIIDINMGCPAKKVIGGYAGSALMREPDHALALIEATVNAVDVPVTLKMRLGWDENSINAPDIARRAEQAGIKLVTIHGRTRMQFYQGRADWDAIRAVRDAVSIPLVANGDVETSEDVAEILRRSGADAVMVGRGCQGRPWHAGFLAGHAAPSASEIADIAVDHYHAMLEFHGAQVGLRHARKHLGWYLDRHAPAFDKSAIMTSTDAGQVASLLHEALSGQSGGSQMTQEAA